MPARNYMDCAATYPLRPEALEAMTPFLGRCANPAATYASGREAKRELERARATVAGCIGAKPAEIFFTSGGTESDNWALESLISEDRSHIVTSGAEHHAVLDTCDALEARGMRVTRASVDRWAAPVMDEVRSAACADTALISLMLANNELGTLTDIAAASEISREKRIPLHVDAVSAAGHIPIDVNDPPVDLMSISAHKLGGPVGVGALYVREGTRPGKFMRGGSQERNLRAGTQNVAGAAGFAAAFEASVRGMRGDAERLREQGARLRSLLGGVPGIRLTSPEGKRCLPGFVHFLLPGIRSEAALVYLDRRSFECAAGSACTSGATGPSHVLLAAGYSEEEARCAVRVSLGPDLVDLAGFTECVSALCGRAARGG